MTLQDRSVTGTLKQPVKVQNGDVISGPGVTAVLATAAPTATPSGTAATTTKTVTSFKTSLPVIENPTLLPLMQQTNVKVNVKGANSGGFLPPPSRLVRAIGNEMRSWFGRSAPVVINDERYHLVACALDGDSEAAIAWLRSIPKQFLPPTLKTDSAFRTLQDRADFQFLFQ